MSPSPAYLASGGRPLPSLEAVYAEYGVQSMCRCVCAMYWASTTNGVGLSTSCNTSRPPVGSLPVVPGYKTWQLGMQEVPCVTERLDDPATQRGRGGSRGPRAPRGLAVKAWLWSCGSRGRGWAVIGYRKGPCHRDGANVRSRVCASAARRDAPSGSRHTALQLQSLR